MLSFETRDPYPLCAEGSHTYAEAQSHSAAVDRWLDLRTDLVESKLASQGTKSRAPAASGQHQQLWFGLATQSLLTPYTEIRSMLQQLAPRPGSVIADLGAAYGRMGFVIARCFPQVRFIGYEYVGERVIEGRRCMAKHGIRDTRLEHVDLTSATFQLDAADIYFIYDYGTPQAIEKTLHDLRRIAKARPVTIVGRGRNCRYAIESRHSWLAKADPAAPEGRTTIYVSDRALFRRGIEAAV